MYTYLKFGLPRVMPLGLEEVYKYQTNLFSLNWLKTNRSDSIQFYLGFCQGDDRYSVIETISLSKSLSGNIFSDAISL